MRLIDADAIPYTMLYKEDWLRGTGVEKPAVWKDTIDEMPTIEAEPVRRGRWINLYYGNYRCSECGAWWSGENAEIVENFIYCPNCGAKMEV